MEEQQIATPIDVKARIAAFGGGTGASSRYATPLPATGGISVSEFGAALSPASSSWNAQRPTTLPYAVRAGKSGLGAASSATSSLLAPYPAADSSSFSNSGAASGLGLRKSGSGASLRELGASREAARVRSNSVASLSDGAPSRSNTSSPRLGVKSIIALYANNAGSTALDRRPSSASNGGESLYSASSRAASPAPVPPPRPSRSMMDSSGEDERATLSLHPSLRPTMGSTPPGASSGWPSHSHGIGEPSLSAKRLPPPAPPRSHKPQLLHSSASTPLTQSSLANGGSSSAAPAPPARVTIQPPSPHKSSSNHAARSASVLCDSPTRSGSDTAPSPRFAPPAPALPPRKGTGGSNNSRPSSPAPQTAPSLPVRRNTAGAAAAESDGVGLAYKARAPPVRGRGLGGNKSAPGSWASTSTGSLLPSPDARVVPLPPPRSSTAATTGSGGVASSPTSTRVLTHARAGTGSDPSYASPTRHVQGPSLTLSDAAAEDLRSGLATSLPGSLDPLAPPPVRRRGLSTSPVPGNVGVQGSSGGSDSRASSPARTATAAPPPRHFESLARSAGPSSGGNGGSPRPRPRTSARAQSRGVILRAASPKPDARGRYELLFNNEIQRQKRARSRKERSGSTVVPATNSDSASEHSDHAESDTQHQNAKRVSEKLNAKRVRKLWARSKLSSRFLQEVWEAAVFSSSSSSASTAHQAVMHGRTADGMAIEKEAFVRAMTAIDSELGRRSEQRKQRVRLG